MGSPTQLILCLVCFFFFAWDIFFVSLRTGNTSSSSIFSSSSASFTARLGHLDRGKDPFSFIPTNKFKAIELDNTNWDQIKCFSKGFSYAHSVRQGAAHWLKMILRFISISHSTEQIWDTANATVRVDWKARQSPFWTPKISTHKLKYDWDFRFFTPSWADALLINGQINV